MTGDRTPTGDLREEIDKLIRRWHADRATVCDDGCTCGLRSGDLRERLAEALYQWTLSAAAPGGTRPPYLDPRTEERLRENSSARADAVLPVVEAALAQQAAEIDEDIIKPERALHEQTIQRAEQAEQQRDAALAALRDLTDGRPCAPHPGNGWCQTHGERAPCPHAEAGRLLAALDQPEET